MTQNEAWDIDPRSGRPRECIICRHDDSSMGPEGHDYPGTDECSSCRARGVRIREGIERRLRELGIEPPVITYVEVKPLTPEEQKAQDEYEEMYLRDSLTGLFAPEGTGFSGEINWDV